MGCDLSFVNKMASKNVTETDDNGNALIDKKVLLLGIDNAGKTSILLQMKDNNFADTVPTVGLNVE